MHQQHSSISLFFLFSAITLISGCSSLPLGEQTDEKSKKQAEIYFLQGTKELTNGSPTAALRYLKIASQKNPNSAQIWNNLGLAYYRKKSISKAIESFKKALQIDNQYTEAKNNIGGILLEQNELDLAEKYLEEASKDLTFMRVHQTYYNLGILYQRRNQIDKAESFFEFAVEHNRRDCGSWYQLAEIKKTKMQYDEAIKAYKNSTRGICYDFPQAHYSHARTLLLDKQIKEARTKFMEIIQQFPKTKWADRSRSTLHEYELL